MAQDHQIIKWEFLSSTTMWYISAASEQEFYQQCTLLKPMELHEITMSLILQKSIKKKED